MIAVLDASAAVEIVLSRDPTNQLTKIVREADWVIAPTLYISEVTNVFWKYQKFANHPYANCEKSIEQAISLPDEYFNELDFYRESFKLGCTLDHPIYDVLYLVLARRHNATLLTIDKKLRAAAIKIGVNVNPT